MKKILIFLAIFSTSAFAGKYVHAPSAQNSNYYNQQVQQEIENSSKKEPIKKVNIEPESFEIKPHRVATAEPMCSYDSIKNVETCWRTIGKEKDKYFYVKENSMRHSDKVVSITFKLDGLNGEFVAAIWKASCFENKSHLYTYNSTGKHILTDEYEVTSGSIQSIIAKELCDGFKQTLK